MKFQNSGMGECFVLKNSKNTDHKLICSVDTGQIIIIHGLNFSTGNWEGGSYYGSDIDSALSDFNKKTNQKPKISIEDISDEIKYHIIGEYEAEKRKNHSEKIKSSRLFSSPNRQESDLER